MVCQCLFHGLEIRLLTCEQPVSSCRLVQEPAQSAYVSQPRVFSTQGIDGGMGERWGLVIGFQYEFRAGPFSVSCHALSGYGCIQGLKFSREGVYDDIALVEDFGEIFYTAYAESVFRKLSGTPVTGRPPVTT